MAGSETPRRPADTLVSRPRGLGVDSRLVLMAGVASACLLGVAAGAWVRPEADDLKAREVHRPATRAAAPAPPAPQMRIVMDAEMLPVRPPMEVLPDWARSPAPPPLAPAIPEFRPPLPRDEPLARLLKVQDEPTRAEPTPKAPDKPKAGPKPAKVEVAKAEKPKPKPKVEQVRSAKADKPKKAKAEKVVLAKVEKAKKTKAVELAKAEKPKKKAKPEKVELARAEKAKKPEKPKTAKIVLAKAEPKPPEKPKPKPMAVLLAEVEKLKAKPVAPPPVKVADAKPPPPKAAAPVKIAKATAKAPRAPTQPARRAENQWADDDLRLARAYRRAAEAGVPEWRLERQQARWRQARDAAEREAPWAVTRVYEARIAELDDLAGEAAMEWN